MCILYNKVISLGVFILNNIIKKVYVLKNYKKLTIREIKKYIKENYGISLKVAEIKKY